VCDDGDNLGDGSIENVGSVTPTFFQAWHIRPEPALLFRLMPRHVLLDFTSQQSRCLLPQFALKGKADANPHIEQKDGSPIYHTSFLIPGNLIQYLAHSPELFAESFSSFFDVRRVSSHHFIETVLFIHCMTGLGLVDWIEGATATVNAASNIVNSSLQPTPEAIYLVLG